MSPISSQSDVLADGREIIYFDDADSTLGPVRSADTRDLPDRPATASMRQDPLTGEWVSIASARQGRAFLPPAHLDPLAPQTLTNPSEVPSNYDVAVPRTVPRRSARFSMTTTHRADSRTWRRWASAGPAHPSAAAKSSVQPGA